MMGLWGGRRVESFTSGIKDLKLEMLKTPLKEWKRGGKILPLPVKTVENPVERVKNSPPG